MFARPFAWRLLSIEYSHTWMGDVAMIHPQQHCAFFDRSGAAHRYLVVLSAIATEMGSSYADCGKDRRADRLQALSVIAERAS